MYGLVENVRKVFFEYLIRKMLNELLIQRANENSRVLLPFKKSLQGEKQSLTM